MTKIEGDDLGSAVFKLQQDRPRMDPRVLPALGALTGFSKEVRVWQNQTPRNRPAAEKLAGLIHGCGLGSRLPTLPAYVQPQGVLWIDALVQSGKRNALQLQSELT